MVVAIAVVDSSMLFTNSYYTDQIWLADYIDFIIKDDVLPSRSRA